MAPMIDVVDPGPSDFFSTTTEPANRSMGSLLSITSDEEIKFTTENLL